MISVKPARVRRIRPLLIGLLLCALASGASGDRRTSLEQAVNEARDRYPGRVLSAETERRSGRESHRIRILTNDGRVKRLEMDAESGRFQRPPRR
jgi:uncharacterized iron-regulated membrane protein